jgi:aerobic carbon-monoxide dehydrogenase medium subunit
VKPPPFEYAEPEDLDAAVELLAGDEDARPLAGGQSLVPMLNFRLVYPSTLVGLSRLPGLNGIERRDGELVIGAMVSQSEALKSSEVASAGPLVREALALIGHPQIRSRGTVGGSLAHADPAAELPAVLLALDGAVSVHGPNGKRSIAAAELFQGFYTTSLGGGEILTEARFRVLPPRTGTACTELARRPGDFATAGVACRLTLSEDGSVAEARVALFAVADAPVRARAVEESLAGARPGDEAWTAAVARTCEGWDARAADSEEARYRIRVAPTIVGRALALAAERAA